MIIQEGKLDASSVGVALLGAGIWAKEALLPALLADPQLWSLKAVYSRSRSSAQALASLADEALLSLAPHGIGVYHDGGDIMGDLDALLKREDIQAIICALPITRQAEVIRKAWQAGKHVLSEKPVAESYDAAVALQQEYQQHYAPLGIVWQVAENYAHESAFLRAAKLISEGFIGEPRFFTTTICNHQGLDNVFAQTKWRQDAETYPGGVIYDGGVHHIRQLQTVLGGDPVIRLTSLSKCHFEHLKPIDTISAACETEKGVQGTLFLTFASSKAGARNEVVVSGSRGRLTVTAGVLPPLFPDRGFGFHKGSGYHLSVHLDDGAGPAIDEWFKNDGIEMEIDVFGRTLLGKAEEGERERASPQHAIGDIGFIVAAVESQGQLVQLQKS